MAAETAAPTERPNNRKIRDGVVIERGWDVGLALRPGTEAITARTASAQVDSAIPRAAQSSSCRCRSPPASRLP